MRRTSARAVAAIAAGGCAVLGAVLAAHYPIAPAAAVIAFLIWIATSYLWQFAWLAVIPALLPVCGLATWTGWFAFEELDLLVLGAAAAGYARFVLAPEPQPPREGEPAPGPSTLAIVLVVAYAVSCGLSLYRGVLSSGSPQFDWIGSYESAMNSVRLFKSFAAALLLWPILRSVLNRDPRRALDSLTLGLALGLGAASLAALWERAAFTDVLNFSSDYRTTALFWEMHVGGAALDGFLALTLPFAIWQLRRSSGALRTAAAMALCAVAAYACLTTFSRGLYLAIPLSLGVIWLLSLRQGPALAPGSVLVSAGKVFALATLGAAAFYLVFRAGGYRSLLAFVATLGVATHVASSGTEPRLKGWPSALALGIGVVVGLVMAALGGLIAPVIPKGPYVVFALAFACNVALALWRPEHADARHIVRWALLAWLAAAAALVALHWGGSSAFRDSSLVLMLLLAAAAGTWMAAKNWMPQRAPTRLAWLGMSAILATGVAVLAGGAYMGDRFSSSSDDLETRLRHWSNGIGMLRGTADWWLGKGFGSFPGSYFFGVPDGTFPGSFALRRSESGQYLALAGPRYPTSWGNLFRIAQRVPTVPATYTVRLDGRSASGATLHVEVCEQHLLYNGACGIATVPVPAGSQWQHVSTPIDAGTLSRGPWYAPRLALFSLAVDGSGQSVDLRRVSLIGADGKDVLANGDFARGTSRWIPISEKYHLPWHIKNLALDLLFDQGLVGLALFVLLLTAALGTLAFGSARRHPLAPYLAAAVTGFMVVGAFDSLLDVPRVAFLFYTLLLTGMTLPTSLRIEHAARS